MDVKMTTEQLDRTMANILADISAKHGGRLSAADFVEISKPILQRVEFDKDKFLSRRLSDLNIDHVWIDDRLVFSKPKPEHSWEDNLTALRFLLPEDWREEWSGDFRELLQHDEGHVRWVRCVSAVGRLCLLGIAAARIRVGDLIFSGQKKQS